MRAIGGAPSGAIHSFWGTLLGLQPRIALYVKDATCEGSDEEGGVACFCQTIKGATVPEPTPEATDDAPATPTDDAAAASTPAEPTTPEIEVGNATTLPAPVPEPEDADKPLEPKTPAAPAPQEETTPLQDYATYEATKDISDPNTAAAAGAAAAQVAGALQ